MFMATHAEFFLKYCWKTILYNYNQGQGKQFSFKGYLQFLLDRNTWGDESILKVISIMWDLTVTIIYPSTLAKHNLRHHEDDLSKVDVLVLYSGGVHYSAIGTYGVTYAYYGVAIMDFGVAVMYYRVINVSFLSVYT